MQQIHNSLVILFGSQVCKRSGRRFCRRRLSSDVRRDEECANRNKRTENARDRWLRPQCCLPFAGLPRAAPNFCGNRLLSGWHHRLNLRNLLLYEIEIRSRLEVCQAIAQVLQRKQILIFIVASAWNYPSVDWLRKAESRCDRGALVVAEKDEGYSQKTATYCRDIPSSKRS